MMAVAAAVVMVATVAASAAARVSDYDGGSLLHIVNGTEATVQRGQTTFVFCYGDVVNEGGAVYRVVWTDPRGRLVPHQTSITMDTSRIFTVSETVHHPASYLVFRDVDEGVEGVYTCHLARGRRVVARRKISLKMFRVSWRVMGIPGCVAVMEGASALLPSPVQGLPPAPPTWHRVDGHTLAHTQVISTGLLLHRVTAPAVYSSQVVLVGGLVHQQQVVVAVVRPDGTLDLPTDALDALGPQPHTPKALARVCPAWDAAIGKGHSRSGVAMANTLIAEAEMQS